MDPHAEQRSDSLLPPLLLAAAAVVVAVGLAVAWMTLQREFSALDRRHGQLLAERIAMDAGRHLAGDDLGALDVLAADASTWPGVRSVTVEAPSHAVTRHAATDAGRARWWSTFMVAGTAHIAPIHVTDPGSDPAATGGRVIVETGGAGASVRFALFALLALLAGAMLAAPAAVWWLRARRRRQAHLRYVLQALREYELGVYRTRVPEVSPGPMGELERGVNRVADAMARSRKDLQIQVNRATLELRQTLEEVEIKNVQLDLARKRAVGASRAKSDFLANMSHEIRTPMNAVVGYTQLLSGTRLDADQREYVETIQGAADNLLGIIDDILNLSRLESGKLAIQAREFSIRDCVGQLAGLLAPAAFRKGIDFVRTVDGDVPDILVGDSLRIRQILTNLVSNAIKFTDAGHVRLDVRAHRDAPAGDTVRVELTVTDTGSGIERADRERLFQPFTRGETIDETATGGTGLGLTICKKLTEAMHGQIDLRSVPGHGSVFTVELPLRVAAGQRPGADDRLAGRDVTLVCEDDGLARHLACVLDNAGASVNRPEPAPDPADWLRDCAVATTGPALVVIPVDRIDALDELDRVGTADAARPIVLLVSTADRTRLEALSVRLGVTALAGSASEHALVQRLCGAGKGLQAEAGSSVDDGARDLPAADMHVLVVEDHEVNRKYLCRILAQFGISTEACVNGAEAVPLAVSGRFDAVLMDIRMPVMDGAVATRAIREGLDGRRLPIIGLTASALPEERLRYMRSGMDECLVKPVNPDMLVTMLRKMTGKGAAADDATGASIDGSDDELKSLLNEELPDRVERMRNAFERRDFGSLRQEVHKINGAAAVLRLHDLWDAAGALEISLADGEYDVIGMQLTRLCEAVEAVLAPGLEPASTG